jgi:hypothetical protein
MTQGTPKKKEMFEKIRSQIERRQILQKMIAEKGEFLCKGEGETLFRFIPESLTDSEEVLGTRFNVEGQVNSGEEVVANFAVGEDRYFMQSSYLAGSKDLLVIPKELFKLQRRAHTRVDIPEKISRAVNITKINGKAVFLDAECLDISAGGARLLFYGDMATFKGGDKIHSHFHLKNKWNFEVSSLVKHVSPEGDKQILGIEFDTGNKGLFNKLQMMMLELQRWTALNLIEK